MSLFQKQIVPLLIEKIKNIDNDENLQIEIELDNGTILRYDNIQKKWINTETVNIKVFNEDYIKENLNLEVGKQNTEENY